MSPAPASDGARSFVVFLVVLLAAMLGAVISAPGRDGGSSEDTEDATRPLPAMAASSGPVPVPFRSADAQAPGRRSDRPGRRMLQTKRAPDPQPGDAAAAPLPAVTGGQPVTPVIRPGMSPARSRAGPPGIR